MSGLLLIVGSLCAIVLIGVVPGAIILRVAIWGDNKMTGGDDSPTPVPEPPIGKAIRISLFTLFYIFIASYLGQLVILHAMDWLQITGSCRTLIGIVTFFLISVLIMASMLRYYLPTTFKSATRVALSWALMLSALVGLLNVIIHYGLG
jgi:hypothetical protein